MELVMIRANIEEIRKAMMARFMNGLNRYIAYILWSCIIIRSWKRWCIWSLWWRNSLNGRVPLKQQQLLGPLTLWKPNWKDNIGSGLSQPNEEGKGSPLSQGSIKLYCWNFKLLFFSLDIAWSRDQEVRIKALAQQMEI
jgi:hypothetical protein